MGKPHISDSHRRSSRPFGHAQPIASKRTKRFYIYGYFGLLLIGLNFFQSCGAGRKVQIRQQPKAVVTQQTVPQKPKVVSQPTPAAKKPKKTLSNSQRAELYIQKFAPVARLEMREFKIPASITLAQGLLESGFGQGRLAVEGNNHFGIKCHKGWTGKTITHDDDEKGECFRVYENPEASYRDHSLFLQNRSRYTFLFKYSAKDYKSWAKGLKKAGYATDPKYPQKLIQLIERFDLSRFDTKGSPRKARKKAPTAGADENTITVQKGDTLYGLARKYGIEIEVIKQKNRLKENAIFPGQVLILPKKSEDAISTQ